MPRVEEVTRERYRDLPDYSIVALYIDTDAYFSAIRTVVDHLGNDREMGGVYVTSTRPARAIMNRLKTDRVRMRELFFVDSISYTVGGGGGQSHQVVYVESPTMLEGVMLKVDWFLRRIRSEHKFVFFDSLNTMAIYNGENILSEFLHIMLNRLRSLDVFGTVMCVGSQIPEAVDNMLRLVCDETIDVRRSAIATEPLGREPDQGEGRPSSLGLNLDAELDNLI